MCIDQFIVSLVASILSERLNNFKMRGAVLALLCVIALSNAEIVEVNKNGCPNDPTYERTLAHKNCFQYYQCVNGILVARNCPNGLLYNRQTEACDLSKNVKCDGADKVINDDPSEAPAICAEAGSEGVLVAHEKCTKFYKCSRGLPVALDCPSNLLYNPQQEYCDWPGNVECGDRIIPDKDEDNEESDNDNGDNNNEANNCDPSAAPAICAKEGSDGVLVANEQCNKFYKCSLGLPVALSCPSSLLYNSPNQYCDWPQNVECGDRTLPGDNDDVETDNDNESEDNSISGNCDPSQAPAICAKEGSDGVLVANEKCTKFYKCFEGVPVTLNCPPGLLYNPSKEYCDWPNNVQCGDRIIPDNDDEGESDSGVDDNVGTNCDPSKAPAICAKDGSDGVLVAHEICNNFYKCSEGIPVALSCPSNLLYDPFKEQCIWADHVKCGDREISNDDESHDEDEREDHSDPSEAPAICGSEKSDGVLVAHEKCNHFYQCSGGVPVTQRCPGSLLFNSKFWRCDWPQNVVCGNRYIPEEEELEKEDDNDKEVEVEEEDQEDKVIHCDPSQAPIICATKGSDGTLVAHEKCNKFYMCAKGLTVSFECPQGLLYNPIQEYCDWPASVTCDNREIPEYLK